MYRLQRFIDRARRGSRDEDDDEEDDRRTRRRTDGGDDSEEDHEEDIEDDEDESDDGADGETLSGRALYMRYIEMLLGNTRAVPVVREEFRVDADEAKREMHEEFHKSDVYDTVQLASGGAQHIDFGPRCSERSVTPSSCASPPLLPITSLMAKCELDGKLSHSRRAAAAHYRLPTSGCNSVPIDVYSHPVFCGRFSESGDLYMSAAQDGHIRLYDTNTWKMIRDISCHDVGWAIVSTAYAPDERWIIYSTWSSAVHLFNVYGESMYEPLDFEPSNNGRFCLFSSSFSPDSTDILAGCSDACVYLYNLERRERTHRIQAHADDVNAVCWIDRNVFVSGSDDRVCKVWDRRVLSSSASMSTRNNQRSEPVGVMVGHLAGISHIDSKDDGRHFISSSKDQTIKLWDLRKSLSAKEGGEANRMWTGLNFDYRAVPDLARRPDLRQALGGSLRHPHDQSLMTYSGAHDLYRTLIRAYFSPPHTTGQRYIYTGSFSSGCVGYDVLTGKPAFELNDDSMSLVRDVSWHPYNNSIALASWSRVCRLWDVHEPCEELVERDRERKYSCFGYGVGGERDTAHHRRRFDFDDE